MRRGESTWIGNLKMEWKSTSAIEYRNPDSKRTKSLMITLISDVNLGKTAVNLPYEMIIFISEAAWSSTKHPRASTSLQIYCIPVALYFCSYVHIMLTLRSSHAGFL